MRIVIGADEAGFEYKKELIVLLQGNSKVSSVLDVGINATQDTHYPDIAFLAAEKIMAGEADRGLLICGTGIGMHISANKVKGIRASVAHDSYSVERSVLSNNCQILTFGARIIDISLAKELTREWLEYEFDSASPSFPKVQAIVNYENRNG